jgi:NADPH:quinone reductase-like Zn-dependent oxidoreductase
MHKISISKPGSYDQLHMETQLPIPTPIAGEVLIEVSYFGINYAGMNSFILFNKVVNVSY